MDTIWLCVAIGLFASALLAWNWPLRIDLSARAQGEPDLSWAAAFGCEAGPFAFTAVVAAGVPLTVGLHLFGKQLFQRRPALLEKLAKASSDEAAGNGKKRLSFVIERLERWFDPAGTAYAALREPRALRVRFVTVDLTYSFGDAALTGRVLGAVYALTGLLPAKIVVRQHPRWDFDDRWAVDVEGRLITRLGRLFVHLLGSMIERRGQRRSRRPAAEVTSLP